MGHVMACKMEQQLVLESVRLNNEVHYLGRQWGLCLVFEWVLLKVCVMG